MKYSKIFRILGIGIILCLLMLAMPATPALATTGVEYIYLPTDRGAIGDNIDVYGYDFDSSTRVYIYFSSEDADVDDYMDDLDAYEEVTYENTNTDGEFDDTFDVPDELTDGEEEEAVYGGDYYVYATYIRDGRIVAKDDFTVIAIEIVPVEGYVGDEIEISGAGFREEKSITVLYDDDEVEIRNGDEETDEDGIFVCYIAILESTAGDHTIKVQDGTTGAAREAEAEFTVEPYIDIDPKEGSIGDPVTVNGTGFGYRKYVTIYFDDDEVDTSPSSVRTGTDGSFEATFDVPEVAAGTYDVDAEDTADNSATKEFVTEWNVTIDPPTGHVGTPISVSGTGFTPGGTVTIKYYLTAGATTGDTEDTTATIGTDGAFSATFNAPASIHGSHIITISGYTTQFVFTMESTPPSTVYPLLPIMDSKLEDWKFDWCGDATDPSIEVTDDSLPITYTLQIATDADFTNIVLQQEGLSTSEYTLTEEEEELLPSTEEEAPYYWRVRAIDAASNETVWTTPGTFYTGFGWPEFQGWPLYTVMGVGGVLLFFLGLWIGRRTVYY